MKHHHYRLFWKRGLYSFVLVSIVMGIGTVGIHEFEHLSYLHAFYFMSMIATAQGSAYTPETTAGILFTSFMSFVSVGTVVAALGFLFGPFFGKLWRIGEYFLEEEIQHLKKRP